jgi:hypothetical protein
MVENDRQGKTGKTRCKTPLPCHFFMLENTCTPGESYVIYPVSIHIGTCVSIMLFFFLFPIHVPFELPICFPLVNVRLTDITLLYIGPFGCSFRYLYVQEPTSYYKTHLLLQDPPSHTRPTSYYKTLLCMQVSH